MITHRCTNYTPAFAETLVANGAEWLESHREALPDVDWVNDINLDILDIRHGHLCIFGQLCASRAAECGCEHGWDWITSHGLMRQDEGYNLGFAAAYDHQFPERFGHNIDMLNAAWKKLITERRAAVSA